MWTKKKRLLFTVWYKYYYFMFKKFFFAYIINLKNLNMYCYLNIIMIYIYMFVKYFLKIFINKNSRETRISVLIRWNFESVIFNYFFCIFKAHFVEQHNRYLCSFLKPMKPELYILIRAGPAATAVLSPWLVWSVSPRPRARRR